LPSSPRSKVQGPRLKYRDPRSVAQGPDVSRQYPRSKIRGARSVQQVPRTLDLGTGFFRHVRRMSCLLWGYFSLSVTVTTVTRHSGLKVFDILASILPSNFISKPVTNYSNCLNSNEPQVNQALREEESKTKRSRLQALKCRRS
jgi:hypothetical protein